MYLTHHTPLKPEYIKLVEKELLSNRKWLNIHYVTEFIKFSEFTDKPHMWEYAKSLRMFTAEAIAQQTFKDIHIVNFYLTSKGIMLVSVASPYTIYLPSPKEA